MDEIPVNDLLYELQEKQVNIIMNTALSSSDFMQIKHLLKQGETLMSEGQFEQAIVCFDQGIEQLGHRYYSDHIDDDTDMKLMLGNIEQQKGHIERAAHLKNNVLTSRVDLYETLYQEKKNKNLTP